MFTLHELLDRIRQEWRQSLPNGWELGWPLDRFKAELSQCAAPYAVLNLTSFDYCRCNTFVVDFGYIDGLYSTLTIHVSFIADLYVMYWSRTRGAGDLRETTDTPSQGEAIMYSARRLLSRLGMQEIPDEWYDCHAPGVSLELCDSGDVTIGKCLFCDTEV